MVIVACSSLGIAAGLDVSMVVQSTFLFLKVEVKPVREATTCRVIFDLAAKHHDQKNLACLGLVFIQQGHEECPVHGRFKAFLST
jgi:hypothetical protein